MFGFQFKWCITWVLLKWHIMEVHEHSSRDNSFWKRLMQLAIQGTSIQKKKVEEGIMKTFMLSYKKSYNKEFFLMMNITFTKNEVTKEILNKLIQCLPFILFQCFSVPSSNCWWVNFNVFIYVYWIDFNSYRFIFRGTVDV